MNEPTRRSQTETFEHTITGLLTKRADTFGEMMRLRDRLVELEADIAAMDRVLTVLGYTGDVEAIPPRQTIDAPFGRGQITRAILDFMREAQAPATARQVAEGIADKLGQDRDGALSLDSLTGRVSKALQRLKRDGDARGLADGRGGLVWALGYMARPTPVVEPLEI